MLSGVRLLSALSAHAPLSQVFPTEALGSSLGAGAAQAHLRSKEALLSLLHTRVLDKVRCVCRTPSLGRPPKALLPAVCVRTRLRGALLPASAARQQTK